MSAKSVLSLMSIKLVAMISTLGFGITKIQCFGTSPEIESFFAGTAVFSVILSLSQSGQLSEIFLPVYHRLKEEFGSEAADRAFSIVLNYLMIFTSICAALSFVFAAAIISICYPGFDDSQLSQATIVFRITTLLLNFEIAASLIKTVLNAEGVYGRPELIGVIVSILGITILVLTSQTIGVWSLIIAFVIGKLITLAYLGIALHRRKVKYVLTFQDSRFDSGKFFRTAFSTIGYALCTQVYSISLNAILSKMPQGTFAIFRYVTDLYTKLRGVFIAPMTTVFFTHFSKSQNSDAQFKQGKQMVRNAITYCIAASSVAWILVLFFGETGLEVLWASKNFDASSISFAWTITLVNIAALAIGGVGVVYRKIVISSGDASIAYRYWGAMQLMTIALIFGLISMSGRDGIRYVLLINSTLLSLASWLLVYRQNPLFARAFDIGGLMRVFVAFTFTLPVAWLMSLGQLSSIVSTSRVAGFLFVAIASMLTIAVFWGIASLVNVPGVRELTWKIQHRLRLSFRRSISIIHSE
jgi:putative peptidoglycan lipid II flippase